MVGSQALVGFIAMNLYTVGMLITEGTFSSVDNNQPLGVEHSFCLVFDVMLHDLTCFARSPNTSTGVCARFKSKSFSGKI